MPLRPAALFATACIFALATACTKTNAPRPADVVSGYAQLVQLSYDDTLARTRALDAAIERFLAEPSAGRFEAAKRAWLDARAVYGQTEAFRFYGGPIDADDGPEGRINGWPLDESYIDYVEGDAGAGIVNKPDVEITKERLASLNEGGGGDILQRGAAFDREKAIATGYHAIEFLLWGQDRERFGPGSRPWQDYALQDAAHPNADRRRTYLRVASQMLVDDLAAVAQQWHPETGAYRKTFVAQDPGEALKKILTGIGVLTKGELAGERIDVALDTLDQEDEHSCFSDNTHADIVANAQGIRNVYFGRYETFEAPSVSELVRAKDAKLDAELRQAIDEAVAGARAIPVPFDEAVRVRDSEGWKQADAVVKQLFAVGDRIVGAGNALGLGNISVSLPE